MSSDNIDVQILRYKTIYTTTAFILGISTVVGGLWLSALDGYYTEAKGLLLYAFGCAILSNNNN